MGARARRGQARRLVAAFLFLKKQKWYEIYYKFTYNTLANFETESDSLERGGERSGRGRTQGMPVSTPTLAAHVTPIPTLTPHWGALLGSQVPCCLPRRARTLPPWPVSPRGLTRRAAAFSAQDNGELPAAADGVNILLEGDASLGMYATGPSRAFVPRCPLSRKPAATRQ